MRIPGWGIVLRASLVLSTFTWAPVAFSQAPMLPSGETQQLTSNVYVIPDKRVNLVPNIGIVVGDDVILVVDTGMGPRNAAIVLNEVRKVSDKAIRYLAVTHFHPEHGMGAQSFPDGTRIIVPMAQAQELADKGSGFIDMFSNFSPDIAELLKDVELVTPDVTFEHEMEIDLGGFTVRLLYYGPGHTRGDMIVYLPQQGILFGGDSVLNRIFPIFPDDDSSVSGWVNQLEQIYKLQPTTVVPGHGAVGDAKLIDELLDYLRKLQARVSELKTGGKSLEETVALLMPEFQEAYKHWDNPEWVKNAVENAYSEN